MGTLQTIIVCREHKPGLYKPQGLGLIHIKSLEEHLHIRLFKVVLGKLYLCLVVDGSVLYPMPPLYIIDIVDPLEVHGKPLNTICDLSGYRF